MREILSILITLSGALAAAYACRPRWFGAPMEGVGGGDRPWRRLGAGLCAVIALLFLLGTSLMDPRVAPRAFLAFWSVLLMLVMWLIALAFKDLRYTLTRYQRQRRDQRERREA